jgi:hypothetical protein
MRDTCGPDFHPNAMRDTKVPGTRLARCRQLDVVHSSFADRVESGSGRRPADSPDRNRQVQNRTDTAAKSAFDARGQAGRRREMNDLVRYRAMESLCRQSAVFRPLQSWRLLAEAEMWHHRAQEEIASRFIECNRTPPIAAVARAASGSRADDESRLLTG